MQGKQEALAFLVAVLLGSVVDFPALSLGELCSLWFPEMWQTDVSGVQGEVQLGSIILDVTKL